MRTRSRRRSQRQAGPPPEYALPRGGGGPRGFTLVEVAIALTIIAMLAAIAIPTVDNITRAELRTSASKLAGMVKATYDLAVLEGKTCRLLFDFAENTVVAEISGDYVALSLGDDRDLEAKAQEDERDSDDRPSDMPDELAGLLAVAKRQLGRAHSQSQGAKFTRAPGTVPYELAGGVKLADVSAEHLRGPALEGKPAIYFFPMGFTEHALIHFEDDSGRAYSVEIEPLTGRTKIADHRTEYKEEP